MRPNLGGREETALWGWLGSRTISVSVESVGEVGGPGDAGDGAGDGGGEGDLSDDGVALNDRVTRHHNDASHQVRACATDESNDS